jgi:Tol biopolymer transport system component
VPFLQSQFDKREVRFSPDGRYVAFVSNESGQAEAYVTPYPGPGARVRLSAEGARLLQWGRDSGTIYFVSAAGQLTAVPVRTSPTLEVGAPTALFTIPGKPWIDFAVSKDGKRFLAVAPEVTADDQPMTVVVDWPASLKR